MRHASSRARTPHRPNDEEVDGGPAAIRVIMAPRRQVRPELPHKTMFCLVAGPMTGSGTELSGPEP